MQTNTEPLLSLDQVVVDLGGTRALDNISLSLLPGQVTTLIGPNGAGKTTLARVALGSLKPNGGRVTRRPGLRLGYMPQRLHIDASMPLTVDRFLWLGGTGNAAQRHQALEQVGIARLAGNPVQQLSGGELQRALLARALLRKPDLLVLDEPAQGVDITGQAAVYELIRQLRDDTGCAVLLISHDLHMVMAGSDQVICLQQHVCCSGTPEAVSRHQRFQDLFPGHPELAAQLAPYRHHHDHSHDLHGEVVESEHPHDHH